MKTKILLVDDHPVFRKGLKLLLEQEKSLKIVGEAGDGQEAIDMVREKQPDVVVMDITMPNLNGIEATRQMLSEFPEIKVIALSIHSGKRFVENMLRAGAVGYILKESVPEELVNGVLKVIAGDVFLSDAITGVLISQYHNAAGKSSDEASTKTLTELEKNYLQLIAAGRSPQESMDNLGVSLETLDEICFGVMEKLEVENETELIDTAKKNIMQGEPINGGEKDPYPVPVKNTKLRRPLLPDGHVVRTDLINRFEQHCDLSLTLVSAPAGYGKSTLISSWLDSYDRPSAWFSIDEKDNDITVFLSHFLAAVRSVFPGTVSKTLRLCKAPDLPSLEIIAEKLISELDAIAENYIMVLDDIHLIHDQSVYELIASLIRHPSPFMHLVVCGRRDPFLPLSILRAKNQMHEFRVRDLRFGVTETSQFLGKELGKRIDPASAEQWAEKTEGWITGLRLAALSIRQRGEYESLLPELTGSIQYITEYLFNELLISQSSEIRNYLLSSSMLDRFCAPLCDVLVIKDNAPANPEPANQEIDGWRFINFLKKENLFILNLDSENYWFRYHHLFQQLLQNQLKRHFSEKEIAGLHTRASQWFFENNQVEEALEHAVKSGDTIGAAEFIEKNRQALHNEDKWFVLKRWLALMPEQLIQERSQLLLARAWVFYHQFKFFEILPVMDTVESLLSDDPEGNALHGEIDFFRGYCNYFLNNGDLSLKNLRSALKRIPETHHEIRGQAELLFGLASQMQGQKEEAVTKINSLLHDNQTMHNLRKTRIIVSLVYMHIIAGDLDNAFQANNQLMDVSNRNEYKYAWIWSIYLNGLIYFKRNEIDEAIDCFQLVKKDRYILHTRAVIDAIAGLSFAYQQKQQPEKATAEMRFLYEFVSSLKDLGYHALADACNNRLAIMQDNTKTVTQWLKNSIPPEPEVMVWWNEIPAVTHCRALIFNGSGSRLQAAAEKLDQYLKLNQSHHNICHQIDMLILLAVIAKKQKNEETALDFLKQAVHLASAGEFIQPFVEIGKQIVPLLESLVQLKFEVSFINKLLAFLNPMNPSGDSVNTSEDHEKTLHRSSSEAQPLVEPLTNREIDILELLSQRLQNKEIAEKLFISPETVKKHLQNIYQKLNAANRREAVENARNIGILIYR